jgi:hypothetical protein
MWEWTENFLDQAQVAHIYYPSFSGDGDGTDCGLRPTRQKVSETSTSTKNSWV